MTQQEYDPLSLPFVLGYMQHISKRSKFKDAMENFYPLMIALRSRSPAMQMPNLLQNIIIVT